MNFDLILIGKLKLNNQMLSKFSFKKKYLLKK
jgi:hypothetical protein